MPYSLILQNTKMAATHSCVDYMVLDLPLPLQQEFIFRHEVAFSVECFVCLFLLYH